ARTLRDGRLGTAARVGEVGAGSAGASRTGELAGGAAGRCTPGSGAAVGAASGGALSLAMAITAGLPPTTNQIHAEPTSAAASAERAGRERVGGDRHDPGGADSGEGRTAASPAA